MSYFACHICGQYKGMIGMVWHPCACPVQNQNKLSAPLPSSEGTVKNELTELTEWDFDIPRDNRFHDPLPVPLKSETTSQFNSGMSGYVRVPPPALKSETVPTEAAKPQESWRTEMLRDDMPPRAEVMYAVVNGVREKWEYTPAMEERARNFWEFYWTRNTASVYERENAIRFAIAFFAAEKSETVEERAREFWPKWCAADPRGIKSHLNRTWTQQQIWKFAAEFASSLLQEKEQRIKELGK